MRKRLATWWAANVAGFRAALNAQLRGYGWNASLALGDHAALQERRRRAGKP